MKPANTTPLKKPDLGDLIACEAYVSEAAKISTKPNYTVSYIWSRFLIASFCTSKSVKSKRRGGVI